MKAIRPMDKTIGGPKKISRSGDARARSARKCERYARERHANTKSFHACVFLLSNSEKLKENI